MTDKAHDKKNKDLGIVTALWQELDRLCNSKHKIIGTANQLEDLPEPLESRLGNRRFKFSLGSSVLCKNIALHFLTMSGVDACEEAKNQIVKKAKNLSVRQLQMAIQEMIFSAKLRRSKNINFGKLLIEAEDVSYAFKQVSDYKSLYERIFTTKNIDSMKEFGKFALPIVAQGLITAYFNRQSIKLAQDSLDLARKSLQVAQESADKQFTKDEQLLLTFFAPMIANACQIL